MLDIKNLNFFISLKEPHNMTQYQGINKTKDELKQLKILEVLLTKYQFNDIYTQDNTIKHKRLDIDKENYLNYLFFRACKILQYRKLDEIKVDIQKCQFELKALAVNIDEEGKKATVYKRRIPKRFLNEFNNKYENTKDDIITRTLKYGQKSFWIDSKTLKEKMNHYTKIDGHWVLDGEEDIFIKNKDVYIDLLNQRVFLLNHNINDIYPYIVNRKITIKSNSLGYIPIHNKNHIMYVDVLYTNTSFRTYTGIKYAHLYFDYKSKQLNHVIKNERLNPMNLLKNTKHRPYLWSIKYINIHRVDYL